MIRHTVYQQYYSSLAHNCPVCLGHAGWLIDFCYKDFETINKREDSVAFSGSCFRQIYLISVLQYVQPPMSARLSKDPRCCKLHICPENELCIPDQVVYYILCMIYAFDKAYTGSRPNHQLVHCIVCGCFIMHLLDLLFDSILHAQAAVTPGSPCLPCTSVSNMTSNAADLAHYYLLA